MVPGGVQGREQKLPSGEGLFYVYRKEEGHGKSYLREDCYPPVITVLAYFNGSFMDPA